MLFSIMYSLNNSNKSNEFFIFYRRANIFLVDGLFSLQFYKLDICKSTAQLQQLLQYLLQQKLSKSMKPKSMIDSINSQSDDDKTPEKLSEPTSYDQQKIKILQESLNMNKQTIERQKKIIKSKDDKIIQLNNKLKGMEISHQQMMSQLSLKNEVIQKLQLQQAQFTKGKQEISTQAQIYRQKLQNLDQQRTKLIIENQSLQNIVKQKECSDQSKQIICKRYVKQIQELQSKLKESNQYYESLMDSYDALKSEKQNIAMENQRLIQNIQNIKSQNALKENQKQIQIQKQSQRQRQRQRQIQYEAKIQQLKNKYKLQIKELQEQISEYKIKTNELNTNLKSKKEQIKQLQKRLASQNRDLSEKINKIQLQYSQLEFSSLSNKLLLNEANEKANQITEQFQEYKKQNQQKCNIQQIEKYEDEKRKLSQKMQQSAKIYKIQRQNLQQKIKQLKKQIMELTQKQQSSRNMNQAIYENLKEENRNLKNQLLTKQQVVMKQQSQKVKITIEQVNKFVCFYFDNLKNKQSKLRAMHLLRDNLDKLLI